MGRTSTSTAPPSSFLDGINGSPLGSAVQIKANQPPIIEGNTVTKRALQITVTLGGNTVLDTVLGESKAGGTCVVPPSPPPCPEGYEYDVATGHCVRTITVPGTGNPRNPCPQGSFERAGRHLRHRRVRAGDRQLGGVVVLGNSESGAAGTGTGTARRSTSKARAWAVSEQGEVRVAASSTSAPTATTHHRLQGQRHDPGGRRQRPRVGW